ncbi:hypothetical protein [Sulfuracidifex tepidarius]|uniref:Uncharacterized protein n=1 Tax=Sulfuracidifex tepidarius TaxID=1294262 RepID=A0A510E4E0_9CREN|nr:hypothetical protein [Sulfuracidifex tepidarius]BBG24593.1 hypothetical protein IC006_1922 [Sulfuracidifex tepidarius]BBG27381.1 hypothetical protein IC007_1930 [Sulfuracidifex tepidarius]
MQLKIGYSDDEELKPIIPLLEGEVQGEIEIIPVKIRTDELKFKLNDLDLSFIPLPIINFVNNIKIVTNGAVVVETLGLKKLNDSPEISSVCVKGSNSTEYYLLRLLLPQKIQPVVSDQCKGDSIIAFENYDVSLDSIWRRYCPSCPLVLNVIGSSRLDSSTLAKVKVLFRESAKFQEEKGIVTKYSKELGLKGREAIRTFFDLCNKKKICNIDFRNIEIF